MQLVDLLSVFRQRWWVVAVTAVVALGAALIYARAQAPVYRSSIRLELSGRFDWGAQMTVERNLRPLAQRVRTTEVAREVDQRLRLDLGPERLLSKVRAEANVDNVQIQIEVDDQEPGRAEALALEFARVFEEQHAARNQGLPQSERTVVSMLDRPTPAVLVWPQVRAIAPVALALGLLIGAGLALALNYLDDTIKSPDDVARNLDLPTLAALPARSDALVTAESQSQLAAESERGAP